MATAQTRDGRKSLAYILEVGEAGTGAIAKGKIVLVTGKASSASVFGDVPVNHFFIANKEVTPATGDTYKSVSKLFCGFATGKSVSESKNVTESTIDYDGAASYETDGIVTKSGSISGLLVTEALSSTSAINPIKQRFDSMMEVGTDGTVTYVGAKTTEKDILLIIWNGRDASTGDLIECEVIPALFSSLSKGGEYGSNQSFSVDFSGNYGDENGYIGDVIQVRASEGFLKAFLKTERTDYNA